MTPQEKSNVSISGAGTVGGGVYNKVSISGAGKVNGDLEAEQVKISGAGKINGNVKAKTFSASGSFKVEADVDASELKCSGAGKILGKAKADNFKASGSVAIGSVQAKQFKVSGSCRVEGDVEAERFRADGSFLIDGLLNADQVEVTLYDDSKAREIGGTQITIVRATPRGGRTGFGWGSRSATLETDSVEGDDIYLEGTRADVVRGKQVKIGPGCRVKTVEYSGSLQIDPDAQVENRSYTGDSHPPPDPNIDPVKPPEDWIRDRSVWSRSIATVRIGGREIRNPVVKLLVVAGALAFAAAVLAAVLVAVLPAIAVVVGVVLGAMVVILVGVVIATPAMGVGMMLWRLITLPFEILRPIFRRRRKGS
jgi:cytoskeletal protein CcmA (bactofilin family)